MFISIQALRAHVDANPEVLEGPKERGNNTRNTKTFAIYSREDGSPVVVRVLRKGKKQSRIVTDLFNVEAKNYMVPTGKLSDFYRFGGETGEDATAADLEADLAANAEEEAEESAS